MSYYIQAIFILCSRGVLFWNESIQIFIMSHYIKLVLMFLQRTRASDEKQLCVHHLSAYF